MAEGNDVDAVRAGITGLSACDDGERDELIELGLCQPELELAEVGAVRVAHRK